VVESHYKYKEDTHSIYNTSAVAMLTQWLLTVPKKLQPWLSMRLYDLCSFGAHNKQRCCSAGLLRVMVEVLEASQEEKKGFSEEVEGQWESREMVSHFYLVFLLLIILMPTDSLIALVEVLGSHSIQAAELKQLIGALRPLENRRVVGSTFTLTPSLV